jgi:hypothetical protein
MHLARDEMAIVLACVCGFIGGCASGYAMSKSKERGFRWLAASVGVGVFVWFAYQFEGFNGLEFPAAIFGILFYGGLMAGAVLLPAVLGCCLVWLILYFRDLCRRRRW